MKKTQNNEESPMISIETEAQAAGRPLNHFWNVCVGAGRANEGLRAGWREHLDLAVRTCGFRFLRFHGLFHDDMFVYRQDADGRPSYNWQYIDDLFDGMLDVGIRPFVELGFCPTSLATVKATVMWWKGNGSPPNDNAKWAGLVDAFTRHCIARYGLDEVRTWYFEVWNEPNLAPFFRGTRSQYFELYKVTAETIKAIDPGLRIGGPATSNFVPDARFDGETEDDAKQTTFAVEDLDSLEWKGVWIEAFLAFCAENRLPLDFLSTHPYPTDFALDGHGVTRGRTRGIDSTRQDLAWLRRVIDASPYPGAEIHLTEWSSSPSSRDHSHDDLPAAAFVVKTNLESTGLVDSLSYWVFSDVFEEGGGGQSVFHGGFGMINYQGIPKPVFHAYRFLAALGDEELARTDGAIVTRHAATGGVAALAWHYPPEQKTAVPMSTGSRDVAEQVRHTGSPRPFRLRLSGLRPHAPFLVEVLDATHGFALAAWQAMGAPEPPDREQTRLLREAGHATHRTFLTADADGRLLLERTLAPWSLIQVREI